MIGPSVLYPQTHSRNFSIIYIHPGSTRPGGRLDFIIRKSLDDRLLDQINQTANTHFSALNINQQISDQLARTVIGNLAPAIHLHHRNTTRVQNVLRLACLTLSVNRLVTQKPYFI